MYSEVPKPDVYVYLYQNIDRLLENIKKRGRDYEQDITPEYLKNIHEGYLNFFNSQHKIDVKIIDISDLDFVSKREDYLFLLDEISKLNHQASDS
jgi:deoxyadenosine/deoxycytidine kinase